MGGRLTSSLIAGTAADEEDAAAQTAVCLHYNHRADAFRESRNHIRCIQEAGLVRPPRNLLPFDHNHTLPLGVLFFISSFFLFLKCEGQ